MFPRVFALLALLPLSMLPVSAFAQDEEQDEVAFTSPAEAGPDFEIQGEYAGSIASGVSEFPSQTVGLQVIARGDGRFDGVLYAGGLPGTGWFGGVRTRLQGETAEGSTELRGDAFVVRVTDGIAEVFNKDDASLGKLSKVHRQSATLGATPPPRATVIFGGSESEHLDGERLTEDGLLMEGSVFTEPYSDFTIHLEFMTPFMPHAEQQGRGNSGVYLQSRYEVQILDSFGLEGEPNECGGLYRYLRPAVNMCLPPLSWQTFDIRFTAAKFDDAGNKTQNARLSVWHNGVVVHDNISIERKTGNGKEEGPDALVTRLQDHHDPVRFRNIWLVDHAKASTSESATLAQACTTCGPGYGQAYGYGYGSVPVGYVQPSVYLPLHGIGPGPMTQADLTVGVYGSYEPGIIAPAATLWPQDPLDYPPVPTVVLPPPAPYWLW